VLRIFRWKASSPDDVDPNGKVLLRLPKLALLFIGFIPRSGECVSGLAGSATATLGGRADFDLIGTGRAFSESLINSMVFGYNRSKSVSKYRPVSAVSPK
jgi:hypothetical protein